MVIWRQGHSLKSLPTDWRSWRSNKGPLGIRKVVKELHTFKNKNLCCSVKPLTKKIKNEYTVIPIKSDSDVILC